MKRFALCESSGATGRLHIRDLGAGDLQPNGGASAPLCKPDWWTGGWDVGSVDSDPGDDPAVCSLCAAEYLAGGSYA